MESLRELYKTGSGPSSSHTIAPQRALRLFLTENPGVKRLEVDLYGSLSFTGKGHFTDRAIEMAAGEIPVEINFMQQTWEHDFPNGLVIRGYGEVSQNPEADQLLKEWVVYSLGGGSIKVLGEDFDFQKNVYKHNSIEKIERYCLKKKINFAEYVYETEPEIRMYLKQMLHAMIDSVDRGLKGEGYLPGTLRVKKTAKAMYSSLFNLADSLSNSIIRSRRLCTYAYATMEENASLGKVVTAPTCGSSGVLASCMYYYSRDRHFEDDLLCDALAVAGLFGNVVKTNATISGAEGGCQAEVGVACAMAAAAIAFLEGSSLDVIEYAAEIAMEHHLGLTCDPIGGYVIVPCIERNAIATDRAFEAAHTASFLAEHKAAMITFDMVVETMKYTGSKIAPELRETSKGGLAHVFELNRSTIYYEDGHIRTTGMVDSSGMRQQQWVHYRKTGGLWQIGYYKDDQKHGPYVKLKMSGDIDSIEFFSHDKQVSRELQLKLQIVKDAIAHAFVKHRGDVRKGGNLPYILHPLEVVGIAFGIEPDNPRLLAAAALHDTIEDTDETYESLRELFGDITDIVAEETEDKSKTWKERKQATIDYFRTEKPSHESRIVALSDKLSNARAVIEDKKLLGDEVWQRFKEKRPEVQKWYYESMKDALVELADTSAWKELNSLVQQFL